MKVFYITNNTTKTKTYACSVSDFVLLALATDSIELAKKTGLFGLDKGNIKKAKEEAKEILKKARVVESEIARFLHDVLTLDYDDFEIESVDDKQVVEVRQIGNGAGIYLPASWKGKLVEVRLKEVR